MKKMLIALFVSLSLFSNCFAAQVAFVNNGNNDLKITYKFIKYVKNEKNESYSINTSSKYSIIIPAKHDASNVNYSFITIPDAEQGVVVYSSETTEGNPYFIEYINIENKHHSDATCMALITSSINNEKLKEKNVLFIFDDNKGSPFISCKTNTYTNSIG